MNNETTLSKRRMLGLVLLPGFIPRFRVLFGQGFAYIPFFIALVYRCVRLLPENHPYLNPVNMGRFGIRNVIGEAAHHLVLSRKNIDQILLFILIIVGMIIIAMQFLLVGMGLFIQSGYAFPQNFNEFFVTANPAQDIAFILLDMVFGVPEMFMSCVDPAGGAACQNSFGQDILIPADHPTLGNQPYTEFAAWPWPIHQGLHQLFALFSYGMMVVAVIITVYFMLTVIAESAQSGTAFGKRFNRVWAPVRVVVAFGLLIPLVYGLNSGQYIVLYAAKYGSGFATNGWIYFNTMINEHYHEGMHELVAKPEFPESASLIQFFFAAATCASMYSWIDNIDINMYAVRGPLNTPSQFMIGGAGASRGQGADGTVTGLTSYDDLMAWNGDSKRIYFRFGHLSAADYPAEKGHVKPLCGEVSLTLTDPRVPGDSEAGAETLQRFYYWLIKKLWFNAGHMQAGNVPANARYDLRLMDKHSSEFDDTLLQTIDEPSAEWRAENIARMTELFSEVLTGGGGPDPVNGNAIDALLNSPSWDIDKTLIESKGWAGAAIWYNRIADMNGALTSAVFNIPMPTKYPSIMEFVAAKKKQYDQEVKVDQRFNPNLPNDTITFPEKGKDDAKALAMWEAFDFWTKGSNATSVYTTPSGNIFNDAVIAIFGTEGLYDMRNNEDVHPLAQLTAIGRSLVESAIRNMGYIAVGGTAGFLFKNVPGVGGTAKVLSSFIVSITMVGLTIGFVLFYVVPFLPFIYFFFAVGGWVKGIFEAMVGIPLWALAHIRIDGEGLPGNAAINGYFLIFEIFIRPILIIFGFLASILIFSAMVETLNNTFDLVAANTGGFSMSTEKAATIKQIEFYRSAIDQFMFTVMYAIVVYLIGQSSFKLIDLIPNNILRWMGQSVTTFNDERADPAEGLVSRSKMGAQQAIGSIGGGVKGLVS